MTYYEERMAEIRSEMIPDPEAHDRELNERMRLELAEARRKEAKRKSDAGWVYFIKAGNSVKIGRSMDVRNRLKSIQTGCPYEARLVKVLRGGRKVERDFHKRFAEYRMTGEWFGLYGRLAQYLEACVHAIEPPEPSRCDDEWDEVISL